MLPVTLHDGTTIYVPTSLGDCDRQQSRDVCHVLFLYMSGKIPYSELHMDMLCAVLNIRKSVENDLDISANLYRLSEHLTDFYKLDKDGKLKIVTNFEDNPFTWLRPGLLKYKGPEGIFDNITFGQYVDALDPFADFADTGDSSFLDALLAIMFVPSISLSRKRTPHHPTSVKRRARKFKRLDAGYKFGFYLYFASFQEYLQTAKVYREGRELDLSILFKPLPGEDSPTSSDIPGLGMLSVQFAMAQSQIFGDNDNLRAQPFWSIIPRMYDIRKQDYDQAMAHKNSKK